MPVLWHKLIEPLVEIVNNIIMVAVGSAYGIGGEACLG